MMAALGPTPATTRAYILDKYFLELEKYWEDEKNNSIRHQRSAEAERVTDQPTSASVISVPSRVSAPARIGDRAARIAGGSAGSMITETLSSDPTFASATIASRVRSMQVLETLMAGGFPVRMRYRAFNIRYRCLAPFKRLQRTEDKTLDDCKLILDSFAEIMRDLGPMTASSSDYAAGRTYIFLSEGARQNLEMIRDAIRIAAATSIQSFWRGIKFRREVWPNLKRSLVSSRASVSVRSASASVTYGVTTRISDRVGPGSASSRMTGTGTVIVHGSEITNNNSCSNHNYGNTMSITAINNHQTQITNVSGTSHNNKNENNNGLINNDHHVHQSTDDNRGETIPDPIQIHASSNSSSDSSSNTNCNTNNTASNSNNNNSRPRPQPIIGTPPPDKIVCDVKVIEQICSLFGLSMERPPPVPPARPYKVVGNIKVMKKTAPVSVS